MNQCIFDNKDNPKKRYVLSNTWDESRPVLTALLLNPSIASESKTDPTSLFMINVSKNHGYGTLIIVNVYPVIKPKSEKLCEVDFEFDSTNYEYVNNAFISAKGIVVGWGRKGKIGASYLYGLLAGFQDNLLCFGQNKKDFSPTQPTFVIREMNKNKTKMIDIYLGKFELEKTRKSMNYFLQKVNMK
jgi:hypothetical protein